MRILVVQESDWLEKGPHQSHHLLERMTTAGHEVRVIDYEIAWRKHADKGIISERSIHFRVHKAIEAGNVTLIRPAMLRFPLLNYLSLAYTHKKEIQRQIDEYRPEIIVGFGLLNANIALRLARKAGIPFVYYIIDELHTLVPERFLRPVARLIERSNMRNSTSVISINEALREYTIQMGADPGKSCVIRAGVDLRLFNQEMDARKLRKELGVQDNELVLFFMGWLYEFSGLKEVALHLAREASRYSRFKLLIIGKGELWDTIQQTRTDNNLENRILLLDWKPYKEVPRYIAASDICILPAHNNRTMRNIVPIKMYEYMASRKPIIATRLPGIVREFGYDNGISYVNKPEDVLELAAELAEGSRLESEGIKAWRFVQPCSWDTVVGEFEEKLRELAM